MPLDLVDLDALDLMAPGASPQPATLDASSRGPAFGPGSEAGAPMLIPVGDIDEDPEQPRTEFEPQALQQLADTILKRGVRQPISVRPHPKQAERWIVNFGSRRLRASKLAGLTEIPAFIDTTADSYDQVIENEQREGLKPLELALFVQKRLAAGDNQAEIAKRLGKSRQYVTLATALIEAPDWLLGAYRQGRCKGMTELYELRRLHGEHPQYIETWTSDRESITRDGISTLRAELSGTVTGSARPGVSALLQVFDAASATEASTGSTMPAPDVPPKPHRQSNRSLHVEMDGQDYQLVVSVAPQKEGHLYVRPLTGGPRVLAPASSLKLLGFVGR